MRRLALVALLLSGCHKHTIPTAGPDPLPLLAVTDAATGAVSLVDRASLKLVRRVEPPAPPPAELHAPLFVVADPVRKVFYVGNFGGGLGRVPFEGGEVKVLKLDAPLAGLALSPDAKLLAVNGARDLTLRLIDLDAFAVASEAKLGEPSDAPKLPLEDDLASTHPIWLPDGSGVLTEDNLHFAAVLVGRDGQVRARHALRSPVHTFVPTFGSSVAALEAGGPGLLPRVVLLATPALDELRAMEVPLPEGESAGLHHGVLLPDGGLVVANMGARDGNHPGRTVACFDLDTGGLRWTKGAVRNAGHVQLFAKNRVAVLGHGSGTLPILSLEGGERADEINVLKTNTLGHGLEVEERGCVLVLDVANGQLARKCLGEAPARRSPKLGDALSESTLHD